MTFAVTPNGLLFSQRELELAADATGWHVRNLATGERLSLPEAKALMSLMPLLEEPRADVVDALSGLAATTSAPAFPVANLIRFALAWPMEDYWQQRALDWADVEEARDVRIAGELRRLASEGTTQALRHRAAHALRAAEI